MDNKIKRLGIKGGIDGVCEQFFYNNIRFILLLRVNK